MARVNYFKDVTTLEDVRVKLIDHLKEIDPKSRRFDTLIDQYMKTCETTGKNHRSRRGKIYEQKVAIAPLEWMKLAMRILAMDGVEIHNEGTWFWVSGNTKKHRKELSALGLKYSGKRQAWWYEDKVSA